MADTTEERPTRSRRNTSGAASRRSSVDRGLEHIISGNHLDDYSQYHGHHYHHDTEAIDDADDPNEESSSGSDGAELSEKDTEESTDHDLQQEMSISEVRGGILNERDLEAGSKIKRTTTGKSNKSRRSIRDPNLVSWDGAEDPDNPKNWSTKRKWAATLIGIYCH